MAKFDDDPFTAGAANTARFSQRLGTGLIIKEDNAHAAAATIKWLSRQEVLVGIPEEDDAREEGSVTNSIIAYSHEFGVPEHNLPARPFLNPGVENSEPEWSKSLEAAATAAFQGDQGKAEAALNRAGMRAVKGVQDVIRGQDFIPLAMSTIEERLRKIEGGHARGKKKVAAYRALQTAREQMEWEAKNIKILQDTNQMFRAITYVIRQA
jgi:hypothetical protein